NDIDADLASLVYSGLFQFNENQKLLPDLASDYKISADGKLYDINLRKDAKWSDGEPLTVDDIIYTFEAISDIKKSEKDKPLLINVSTGDRDTRCAATSAAFVNGIRAFAVEGNEAMLLPILKFSYYKMLTDKKLDILRVLYENKDNEDRCCASLDELGKRTNMSLPLISYHINGTMKSEGLKELGLVETVEKKGKMEISLSMMGRLLIKGYIK
ncbi:MAG: ABC transporter substrate-binding protein, partial [Nanoarchaeota archaeon]